MAEIRIDAGKAERMIAQILRDERKLLPADANTLAAYVCRRLSSAMSAPTNPPLQGYRIIREHPPYDSDFTAALAKKIADVNGNVARELWKMVYDRGRDLPPTVADLHCAMRTRGPVKPRKGRATLSHCGDRSIRGVERGHRNCWPCCSLWRIARCRVAIDRAQLLREAADVTATTL